MLDIAHPFYPLLPSLALAEPSEPNGGACFQRGHWVARHGVILSMSVHMRMMRPIGIGLSWPLTVVTLGCLDEGEPGMAVENIVDYHFHAITKHEPSQSWSLLGQHARVQSIPVYGDKSIQIVGHSPHREVHRDDEEHRSDSDFVESPQMIVFDGHCQVTGLSVGQARRLSLLWRALLQGHTSSGLNHA